MISMVWAQDKNGLIGTDGHLPWHRPEDLKNFSKLTRGQKVVMGKNTYKSIGKLLPHRDNIIISKTTMMRDYPKGLYGFYTNVEDCIRNHTWTDLFIIGGGQVYKSFAPYTDRLYVTVIDDIFPLNGSEATFFPWPAFSSSRWNLVEERKLGPDYHYVFDREVNNGTEKESRSTPARDCDSP